MSGRRVRRSPQPATSGRRRWRREPGAGRVRRDHQRGHPRARRRRPRGPARPVRQGSSAAPGGWPPEAAADRLRPPAGSTRRRCGGLRQRSLCGPGRAGSRPRGRCRRSSGAARPQQRWSNRCRGRGAARPLAGRVLDAREGAARPRRPAEPDRAASAGQHRTRPAAAPGWRAGSLRPLPRPRRRRSRAPGPIPARHPGPTPLRAACVPADSGSPSWRRSTRQSSPGPATCPSRSADARHR